MICLQKEGRVKFLFLIIFYYHMNKMKFGFKLNMPLNVESNC